MQQAPNTLFDNSLADECLIQKAISKEMAVKIFHFFKSSPLFRWHDANNDCEDRANAVCLLLDQWGIPNHKVWVFSGYFLKKRDGRLANRWKYHVATTVPVQEEEVMVHYAIDPATSASIIDIESWALQITESGHSYHFTKEGQYYIFPPGKIKKDNWYKRNKRNHNWTMQGLSGINGASPIGKAQLAFLKNRVKKTKERFEEIKKQKPF